MLAFDGFRYTGWYHELPSTASPGDIVMVNGEMYVWMNQMWHSFGDEQQEELPPVPTNCRNCGGIVNKYRRKCEFCGTEY